MNPSFTYYLVQLILKLKGVKKNFSQDPIDVKKIRKEDVIHPKGRFYNSENVRKFEILNSKITEVKNGKQNDKLILFIHGGAYISGPAQHHWDSFQVILKQTNCSAWMCDYPKAPEHKISEISNNVDAIYQEALKNYSANQIILLGDSVGGALIAALTQRLIQKGIELPKKIILISPVMDATMTNPEIDAIDQKDPMLSKAGVLSGKKMCVGEEDLSNAIISPLNGSFDGFPKTIMFVAEHDITYPDQLIAIQKMEKSGVNVEVINGKKMPHIWPLLPVMKEAKIALKTIIKNVSN